MLLNPRHFDIRYTSEPGDPIPELNAASPPKYSRVAFARITPFEMLCRSWFGSSALTILHSCICCTSVSGHARLKWCRTNQTTRSVYSRWMSITRLYQTLSCSTRTGRSWRRESPLGIASRSKSFTESRELVGTLVSRKNKARDLLCYFVWANFKFVWKSHFKTQLNQSMSLIYDCIFLLAVYRSRMWTVSLLNEVYDNTC